MSRNKNWSRPQLLGTRNTSSQGRSVNWQTPSPSFPSVFRKISDPRFDAGRIHYPVSTNADSFRPSSRFPKLVFLKDTKNVNRVVNLNTACERKYRSWSDPNQMYTGEREDGGTPAKTCNGDMNRRTVLVPGLRRGMKEAKDIFETKSFCDSLSSYPCSSAKRSSMSSPVPDDGELCFISKRKTLLNWIYSIEKTSCRLLRD